MSWYDEYNNLLDDFTRAVEDELLQYVRGLILYGSYQKEQEEPGWIIPGISDIDFILVVDIDDINEEKPPRRLAKIGEALSVFFVHPVYAPILDLRLLEYTDLPARIGMGFSPIHAIAAAQYGEAILGKNVLENFTYSEKLLNRSAKIIINQGYESIKRGFLHHELGVEPVCFEFADIVLDIAHAALAASGIFNLVRPEVPEKFDLLLGDQIGSDSVDIVYESKKWRMGSQKMEPSEFLRGSLKFAQAVIKHIRNPFNSKNP
ncbi:MAG: hypothetical protein JSW11_16090 [Candidatus Heimdallarchaeota archaeon]|nr:MAG: hypothetical protein JSW11_16090 [Candidatus Heimdallarchaeota archaeon]